MADEAKAWSDEWIAALWDNCEQRENENHIEAFARAVAAKAMEEAQELSAGRTDWRTVSEDYRDGYLDGVNDYVKAISRRAKEIANE